MWDVVVIGGGLAGLLAGIRAAQRQKKVLLVTEGVGTLFFFSGIIDYGDVEQLRLLPGHPYQLFDQETINRGRKYMEQVCPDYIDTERSEAVLSPLGLLRSGDLVPKGMKLPNLLSVGSVVLLVPNGLKDFFPEIVVPNLTNVFKNGQIYVENLVVEEFQRWFELGRPITSVDYADYWRTQKGHKVLKQAIGKIKEKFSSRLENGEKSVVVVMPSLVTEYWENARRGKWVADFPLSVMEISSFSPSPHGRHLAEYLRHIFQDLGGEIVFGARAVRSELEPTENGYQRCKQLVVQSKGKELILKAEKYILATGGLLGGGIEAINEKREIREAVFDLPVFIPEEWSSPHFFEDQPYAFAGIMTDHQLCPINPLTREVVLENVYVVGRLLAHWDPWIQRCGAGVSITSGFVAGESV